MRKPKPLPFKKGDKVLIAHTAYGIRITQAVVTQVRQELGIVHTNSIDQHGNIWKQKFGREAGRFGSDPYPIWQLRPMNSKDNMANLQKRARSAQKQYQHYGEERDRVYREVTNAAADWERAERQRRKDEVPDQFRYIERVASRMGFHRPPSKN